jgi:hypothetical protein
VLKEAEAGAKTSDLARRLGSDDLQLEIELWRAGGVRSQTAEGGPERER